MAKSLQERIASARSTDRVTIKNLEEVIADAEAERDRLGDAHVRASSESIDFALSEEDRDEAAAQAERYGRGVLALAGALDDLTDKLEAKRNSESRKAEEAEKLAAIAERDEIAAEFEAFVPEAIDRMMRLFYRIEANTSRLRASRAEVPNAEVVARGIPAINGIAGQPESYLKMKIPMFGGSGRAWPRQNNRVDFNVGESKRFALQQREAFAEQKIRSAKRHAQIHGHYRLSTGVTDGGVQLPVALAEKHKFPSSIRYASPWEGELPHAIIAELRQVSNLQIEAFQSNDQRT